MRHQQLLEAGARIFAISIDPPERNAAMVEKLSLPFPYLSDPDRSQAIIPYGVADEIDERRIARPAIVVVTPAREEAFRFVSRDFADRMPEDEVVAAVHQLNLAPTTQEPPERGPAEPGPRSLSTAMPPTSAVLALPPRRWACGTGTMPRKSRPTQRRTWPKWIATQQPSTGSEGRGTNAPGSPTA